MSPRALRKEEIAMSLKVSGLCRIMEERRRAGRVRADTREADRLCPGGPGSPTETTSPTDYTTETTSPTDYTDYADGSCREPPPPSLGGWMLMFLGICASSVKSVGHASSVKSVG